MTTFNMKAETTLTRNRSGHVAYRLNARDRLMSYVLTSFVNEPKYYGDNTPELVTLAKELAATDGLFVAQLAVYARTVMNMRSSSHLLLATLAHEVKGEQYVRRAVRTAVVRGDDVTEMLAAYFALFPGEPLPNSLRRGLRDALDRMGDYELAKYRMADRPVKMADAVKLCHTRRREATRALLAGELGKPTSWETELSAHGGGIAPAAVPVLVGISGRRGHGAAPGNVHPWGTPFGQDAGRAALRPVRPDSPALHGEPHRVA